MESPNILRHTRLHVHLASLPSPHLQLPHPYAPAPTPTPPHRRIRKNNEKLNLDVLSATGGWEVLQSVGFEEKVEMVQNEEV